MLLRMNAKHLNKILNNSVRYSYGFLDGIRINQIDFNQNLAEYTVTALGKYIDTNAKMNPKALHHVYEWDRVGDEEARLFVINPKASTRVIHLDGKFLKSQKSNENGQRFANKASVMENGISVTIEPKNSPVLVFENEGETVFTANSVFVAHPGGDEVAGSFARVVEEFFSGYFTSTVLQPIMKDLVTAEEFYRMFPKGSKSGKAVGIVAGKKYLDIESLGEIA